MIKQLTGCGVALFAGMLFVGCEKQEGTTVSDMADKAKDATSSAVESGKDMAETAKAKVGEVAGNLTAEADKLLTQAKEYIGQNKLDDASKVVDQLVAMKDKLPAEWQTKIDEVSKMLATAKEKVGSLMNNIPKPN